MIQYIYIPLIYEDVLAQSINSWLQNPSAWTVITGIYKQSEILNDSDSKVINKTKSGEIINIKYGFKDENNNIYSLIGFCLEGDIERYTPALYDELIKHTDILIFNSSEEFLKNVNN